MRTAPPAPTGRSRRIEEALRDMLNQAEKEGWTDTPGDKRTVVIMARQVLKEESQ